ncbi:acyl-CoA synthetase [Streptomyces hygroscopicus subsp. hygroscopicus]|uniref:class I adenylate-forming enzyme family protein n=1 Tax=Streptomyces sp. KHY 26 TaxID=3097359 RepID=UPI0024A09AD9|nr:fatty acid--CoA ligase family protein [Streptomyces hygroscopicus]GLX52831.1 acyl-CoA synthetase [Streptomyces hygroscopicus subsp. hygroscopicus]
MIEQEARVTVRASNRPYTRDTQQCDAPPPYLTRILAACRAEPARTVLRWRELSLTGRDFAVCVAQAHTALLTAQEGHLAGPSTVGLLTEPNHPALLTYRYAAHLLGHSVVHLRSTNPGPDGALIDTAGQAEILGAWGARLLVVDEAHRNQADAIGRSLGGALRILTVGPMPGEAPSATGMASDLIVEPDARMSPDLITYTSGSTGRPKAVRQRWAAWNALVQQDASDLEAEHPVMLVVTPLSHAVGAMADAVLAAGGSLLLHERFTADAVLDAIGTHRVTRTYLAVPHLYALLEHPRLSHTDVSSLRALIYSGSPAVPARLDEARRTFGHCLVQCYGTTEAGRITALDPLDHAEPDLLPSVGRPFPGIDVRVCPPDGTTPLPDGSTGEVWVRSPYMMSDYPADPALTGRTLHDGWLRTGDLGHWDVYGYLHLTGRRDGVIKTAGVRVRSEEVARVLAAHPDVRDAVVYGVRDSDAMEHVAAAVAPHPGRHDAQALLTALARQAANLLSPQHAPSHLVCWRELPLTDNGKPDMGRITAPHGDPDVLTITEATDMADPAESEAADTNEPAEIPGGH